MIKNNFSIFELTQTKFGSVLFLLILLLSISQANAKHCEYQFTVWNTKSKTSEGPFKVKKDYKNLTKNEIGPQGCTPCEIDQEVITLSNKMKVKFCTKLAKSIKSTLNHILKNGYPFETILGYRASVSKGEAAMNGQRSELSNHAFGVAIDLNENYNGLYTNCFTWNRNCRLQKGGRYDPGHPLALTKTSLPVRFLKQAGLKWGGEISGRQKDFMHFSLSGY